MEHPNWHELRHPEDPVALLLAIALHAASLPPGTLPPALEQDPVLRELRRLLPRK